MSAEAPKPTYDTSTLEPAINTVIKESKAGFKTTEFWVAVVVSLLTVLEAYPVPDDLKAVIVGAISVAYAVSRGISKSGVPAIEPPPSS
jgi:hypothetical protein